MELDLESEVSTARTALGKQDWAHAAHHIANVVGMDPHDDRAEALIDDLRKGDPQALDLVPEKDDISPGEGALRAALLARSGETSDAIALLLSVQKAQPGKDYLSWGSEWLKDDATIAKLDLKSIAQAALPCVDEFGLVDDLYELLNEIRTKRKPHALFYYVCSKAARQSGETEEGLEIIQEAHAEAPDYMTAVGLAGARRELGQVTAAAAAYEDALKHRPDDVPVRNDLGDLYLDLGRFKEAADAYAAVVEREPQHPWARPSLLFARWKARKEDVHLQELEKAAREGDEVSRARDLYDKVEPYVYKLSPPPSSLVNMAAGCLDRNATITQIGVSSLEPPSALLSFRMAMDTECEVDFGDMPTPDPRVARMWVRHTLWTYRKKGLTGFLGSMGSEARPALRPPASEVASAIAESCRSPYSLDALADEARALARRLGPTVIQDVLATMVNPPPTPEGILPWNWLFRVQVFAALTASWVDNDWKDSVRREALMSLLNGPVDWTTTAGIIAATELARSEHDIADAIRDEALGELLREPAAPIYHSCVFVPLVSCMLRLPNLPNDLKSSLVGIREKLEAAEREAAQEDDQA